MVLVVTLHSLSLRAGILCELPFAEYISLSVRFGRHQVLGFLHQNVQRTLVPRDIPWRLLKLELQANNEIAPSALVLVKLFRLQ